MKAIVAILVVACDIFFIFPSFAQDLSLKVAAATGSAWGNSKPEVISVLLKAGANAGVTAKDGSFAIVPSSRVPKFACYSRAKQNE